MLLKVGKLAQGNAYLSDRANILPSLSTEAYPLRKTIVHFGICVVTSSVSLPLTLRTPKQNHHERADCFSEA